MTFDKKAYQREYMRRKRLGLGKPEPKSDDKLAGARDEVPSDIPEREWKYALERAERAKRYAEMFPEFVRPSELRYQDAMWQWENEVRGRFGGIIGGSLSGSRGPHAGN